MSQVDLSKLADSPLFKGIEGKEIELLSSLFTQSQIPAEKTIFIENMPGESLYIIMQGSVKISQMLAEVNEQEVMTLGAGDTFGEMAVIDEGSRTVTAQITEDALLYSLNRNNFNKLVSDNPQLALQLTLNIVKIFNMRIRSAKEDYRTMLIASLSRKG
ncbi:MAG: cyclic nucleotide-binding domain-containing protein [Desulfuromusa sp.]|nr:cyclic nucleotide-binding domain-containing protein [Desulfuromusa sp.]